MSVASFFDWLLNYEDAIAFIELRYVPIEVWFRMKEAWWQRGYIENFRVRQYGSWTKQDSSPEIIVAVRKKDLRFKDFSYIIREALVKDLI